MKSILDIGPPSRAANTPAIVSCVSKEKKIEIAIKNIKKVIK